MQKQILSNNQQQLLPLIKQFGSDFILVGGTAIALYLGHRRSIDFDLFTYNKFSSLDVRQKILQNYQIDKTLIDGRQELTVVVNSVKLTFHKFPYEIQPFQKFENTIQLPNLKSLAAMKTFALGGRAKWKDYVDLYFLFNKLGWEEIINQAKQIFGKEFNEKLLRTQLSYYEDIDYSEKVEFMPNYETNQRDIQRFLTNISLQTFNK